MSWWTKNRKKVGILAGLLGAGAATAATGGAAAPLFGGLLGGEAAAGAGLGEALAASQGVGQAGLMKGGLDAALAAEGGSEMGLAGTKAVSDAYFGNAAPMVQKTAGLLGNVTAPKNAGMAMMGASMLQPQQQPMQPMPPPPPAAPPPQSSFTGYGDPMANLTEEQKRKLMMMLSQGGMR